MHGRLSISLFDENGKLEYDEADFTEEGRT